MNRLHDYISERQSTDASQQRQDGSLEKVLPEQSCARRSEREADRGFKLPANSTRQQEGRHGEAHHTEHNADQTHQNPEGRGIRTVQPIEAMTAGESEKIGDRAGFDLHAFWNGHGSELTGDLTGRCRFGYVRVEARHRTRPPVPVVLASRTIGTGAWLKRHFHRQRREDVGPLTGSDAKETWGVDANHVCGNCVDADDPIERIWETAHVVHPVPMAHNHHGLGADAILAFIEGPAANRLDTQSLEEIAADVLHAD